MHKFLALSLAMIVLTGCAYTGGKTYNAPPQPNPPPVSSTNIESESETQSKNNENNETDLRNDSSDEDLNLVAGDYMKNSSIMVDTLYEEENIMISPMSIYMAIGLAATGADGETLKQFEDFLGMSINDFEDKMYEFINTVPESDFYEQKLNIANSIWVVDNGTCKLSDDFVEKVKNTYNSEINIEDFNIMIDAINTWVNNKTDGMIPSVLSELNPNTVAILINAIYFEAEWSKQYFDDDVIRDSFTNIDGNNTSVDLMCSEENTYYENEYATAFKKTYGDGSYYFVGILPKSRGDFNLNDLDISGLLKTETSEYKVRAQLPKFEFNYCSNLNDLLANGGIRDMFDSSKSNFSKMFSYMENNIYVDSVIHQTKIENNEWGTKAAAVTMMLLANDSISLEEPEYKKVFLDRPFAFIIMSKNSDIPLFIGKVIQL